MFKSMVEVHEELLKLMFQITELKIKVLPLKQELVLLKDKNTRLLITTKISKILQTIFTIKAKTKLTKKTDIFIKKE